MRGTPARMDDCEKSASCAAVLRCTRERNGMDRTKIAQLYADAETLGGQQVTVAGWVKSCLLYTSLR